MAFAQATDAVDTGASPAKAVQMVPKQQMYAPTALPDRIVLGWTGDPRTTQSVNWRTSVEVVQGIAELVEAQAGPYFSEKAKQFVASSEAVNSDLSTARYHSVTFQALKPGKVYAYRLGDGTNWTEWFHFRTAAAENEPFSFIYFGDAQNNLRSMWSRVVREAHRDAPKAAFLLHAGDLVNAGEADAEWGEWFGAGAWLNAMIPNVVVPGNHEYVKLKEGERRLSQHWRPSFALPVNGPEGLEETCYTFTYHQLRVIALNSNVRQAEQAVWLDQVLSQNQSTWVICTFHHPIYSTGRDRDNPALRALWKPIFDKYRVDLVLTGHDHTYGRTGLDVPDVTTADIESMARLEKTGFLGLYPRVGEVNSASGVQKVDETAGTVYVVSVSGPKMYNNSRHAFMKRLAEDTQLYQVLNLDGEVLRYESRTAVGELYDAFELHKQAGKANRLVEIEPQVAQRLRPE